MVSLFQTPKNKNIHDTVNNKKSALMVSLFQLPQNKNIPTTVNNKKSGLSEEGVKHIIDDARIQLKKAYAGQLQRNETHVTAHTFFGRKANKVMAVIAQNMLREINKKTNDPITGVNQVITAIKAIEPPYSNIVFALTERLGPMLLTLQQTQTEIAVRPHLPTARRSCQINLRQT